MQVINYDTLRTHLKENLDKVSKGEEELVVKRPKGKGDVVIISETVFTSMQETAYLLSRENNRRHLAESIAQANAGEVKKIDLDNLWK
ncbi:type II toxin-antitoxin system Phd/YefM family antitoxin [Chitinophaga sp. CC14]|uniref:type II toxin-antitoxin system Phd/YefM family antitoxin n=1 Tax=Chitinophaga sp. CC14 TaxID=3029199 RepID=UPI003B82408F